jgi:glycogen debranching enzyme
VLNEFWVNDLDGGYVALATDRGLDGQPRRLEVRSSNMGHLLNSRLLDGSEPDVVRKRQAVVATLFRPDMLATAGVRTLSNREKGFNPVSYHNGGVWPHDTAWIAVGLERHGFYGLSWELHRRVYHVIETTHSFPEVAQGGNGLEPRLSTRWVLVWNPSINRYTLDPLERTPQEIQAWVVAANYLAKCKWPLPANFSRKLPAMPHAATDPALREIEATILSGVPSVDAG